jgi:hypothetical protein
VISLACTSFQAAVDSADVDKMDHLLLRTDNDGNIYEGQAYEGHVIIRSCL